MDDNAEKPLDLALLKRQDAGEFARLVLAQQGVILGLGQSLGFAGPDLDDAAAEVFAAVYRALPSFEGRSALGTWAYQIACRTLWKLRERRSRTRSQGTAEDRADPEMATPADEAQQVEENQRLWDAVAELEPRQATAVELYYRREFPLEQVAQTMGCPVGTVKTLLFRARERLRRVLAKEEFTS